jgi:hypothetical protein
MALSLFVPMGSNIVVESSPRPGLGDELEWFFPAISPRVE